MGAEKSKLAIEEYDPTLDPKDVTAVIFVRHGTSCANVRKKRNPAYRFDHTDILDPGLTRKGMYDARDKGIKLREKLVRNYGKIPPMVCASVLLRTQMTAYMMMNPNLEKEYIITILPYISEVGNRFQDDNKPRSFDKQQEMLTELGLTEFSEMKREGYTQYKGDDQPEKLKPNLIKFTKELKELCDKNKTKQIESVPTTRCSVKQKMINISERDTRTSSPPIVIVTHGHVLEEFFKKMGSPLQGKSDRPNFVAFRVYFNHKTGHFIRNPDNIPYYYQYDLTLREFDVDKECEWESKYPACESEVCDTTKSVRSTKHIGGRRTRKKVRKHAQKNS